MRYYQKTIDFDELRAGINEMFPVKPKPEPEPELTWDDIERRARALIPARFRSNSYRREILEWIGTPVTPVDDMQPVEAYRVSRSLAGGGLEYSRSFTMDEIRDPQGFVNECGCSMELRNAAGQIVGKFFPQNDVVSFV